MRLVVRCDGASRGNPGEAAAGVMLLDEFGAVVGRVALRLGVMTNNQAEYHAVLAGMQMAGVLAATELEFRLDSELAVRQLMGDWKIKDARLRLLAERVLAAVPPGATASYVHVPRRENVQADRLANWALDRTNPDEP